jgi:hypothetical protein
MSKKTHRPDLLVPFTYKEDNHVPVSPEDLARCLGDLRYDGMAGYLDALAKKLSDDSRGDGGRGRGQLAERLQRAAFAVDEARLEIEAAWAICEPYMPVSKDAEQKKT